MKYPKRGTLYLVEKTLNGEIITSYNIEDGKIEADSEEKICNAEGEDEYKSFQYFLYHILENYGPSQSKHNPKRIYISVDPGHNTEGMTEDEEYCVDSILQMIREEGLDATIEYYETELKRSKEFRKANGY
jgi:hypothetical protein